MNPLSWLYQVHASYRDPIEQRRAQGLLMLNLAIALITVAGILIRLGLGMPTGFGINGFAVLWFIAVFVVTIYLVQQHHLQTASLLYLVALTPLLWIIWLEWDSAAPLGLIVLLAGMLLGSRAALLSSLVMIAILVTLTQLLNLSFDAGSGILIISGSMLAYAALMRLFGGEVVVLSENIQTLERRTDALTFLGRELEQYPDADTLLNGVSLLLRNTMSAQQVQIYLHDKVDDTRFKLVAGTSLGVRRLAGQLVEPLPTDSPLLDVLAQEEPLLLTASDLHGSSAMLAPGAQAMLLFPLKLAGERLGVVEIQGFLNDLIDAVNVHLAEALLSQMAVALSRFDLQTRLTESEAERQRFAGRVEQNMQQIQLLNRQIAGGAWQRFFETRGQGIIGYDLRRGEATPIPANDLPPDIRATLQRSAATVTPTEEGCRLSVPILLRDHPLGAMEFHIKGPHDLPDETVQLAETVALRLSLTLDNARLIEQVQALANREQQVGTVAERLQQASDLEHLLTLATQEFSAALGSASTRIRLQLRENAEEAPAVEHNGGGRS